MKFKEIPSTCFIEYMRLATPLAHPTIPQNLESVTLRKDEDLNPISALMTSLVMKCGWEFDSRELRVAKEEETIWPTPLGVDVHFPSFSSSRHDAFNRAHASTPRSYCISFSHDTSRDILPNFKVSSGIITQEESWSYPKPTDAHHIHRQWWCPRCISSHGNAGHELD